MKYGVDMLAGAVDSLKTRKKNEYKGNCESQARLSKPSDSVENAWRREVRSDGEEMCWKCWFEKWRWRLEREEKINEGDKIWMGEVQIWEGWTNQTRVTMLLWVWVCRGGRFVGLGLSAYFLKNWGSSDYNLPDRALESLKDGHNLQLSKNLGGEELLLRLQCHLLRGRVCAGRKKWEVPLTSHASAGCNKFKQFNTKSDLLLQLLV